MSTSGRLEVITGPMYCGKSEELIRRLRRARIARQTIMSFKPLIDVRYDPLAIASHSNMTIDCTPVETVSELYLTVMRSSILPDVVGIDEAQFFDSQIVEHVITFLTCNIRVVLAGLDTDFRGKPFGSMPTLLAIADKVLKLSAVCIKCGLPAVHTHRLTDSKDLVQVGAQGMYEARCRSCWSPAGGA